MEIKRQCEGCGATFTAATTKELRGGICDDCARPEPISEEAACEEEALFQAEAETFARECGFTTYSDTGLPLT